MSKTDSPNPGCPQPAVAQPIDFLQLLPFIRRYARQSFCNLKAEAREEAVQEVVANSFATYRRLIERGKTDAIAATPLARFAVAQVRDGRRVGGRLNVKDVSSEYCQGHKGIELKSLEQLVATSEAWEEILVEDRSTTPADIVAIRLDFGSWLETLSQQNRQVAEVLSTGETTQAAAKLFKVTSARVSQLRSQLRAAWNAFQGEASAAMLVPV